MIGRIVEVASDNRHLSKDRGFLVVRHKGEENGRVPLDDVAAVIANAHGLTYSNNLLVALAERGSPFVLCGANHRPVALLWPVEGHHRQAARMDAQWRASLPLRKRLWKQIVQSKIGMQAATLAAHDQPSAALHRMASKVRSGDPSNIEGQAARAYWTLLFGKSFRRDHDAGGVNALLNYGYTVLRACVARHVMAAGLHPGVPLHHANEGNAMRLIDDLMEPFRPLVDGWVRRLAHGGTAEVDAHGKRVLARLPTRSLATPEGISPLGVVVQRLAVSLAQVYESPDQRSLLLPPAHANAIAPFWDEDHDEADTEDGD